MTVEGSKMKQYLTGLHHFGIPTTDIDGTVAFYQKLGAEILFEKTDEEAAGRFGLSF